MSTKSSELRKILHGILSNHIASRYQIVYCATYVRAMRSKYKLRILRPTNSEADQKFYQSVLSVWEQVRFGLLDINTPTPSPANARKVEQHNQQWQHLLLARRTARDRNLTLILREDEIFLVAPQILTPKYLLQI
jgi:hypothetical protein